MNFRTFIESKQAFYVHLLNVDGFTSGHHGYGDIPERTAANPAPTAKWQWYVQNPKTWDVLKGSGILILDNSGGSAHERWCRIDVYAGVDEPTYSKLEYLEPNMTGISGHSRNRRTKETEFTFNNYNDLVKQIKSMLGTTSPLDVQDHESGEDYWRRMQDIRTAGMQRDWDGD